MIKSAFSRLFGHLLLKKSLMENFIFCAVGVVFYSDITEVDLMFFLLISNKFRTSLLRNYSRLKEANDYQNLAELQLKLQQGSNWEMKIKLLIARLFKIFG